LRLRFGPLASFIGTQLVFLSTSQIHDSLQIEDRVGKLVFFFYSEFHVPISFGRMTPHKSRDLRFFPPTEKHSAYTQRSHSESSNLFICVFRYFWQIVDPSILAYITPWICYLAHQLTVWSIIYKAQYKKPNFDSNLRTFNYELLAVNGFFHIIHLIQTHWWYSGLAQTVTVWSSQGSVIAILIFVLIIQNERYFQLIEDFSITKRTNKKTILLMSDCV
jgi:hypothetical protein